MSLYKVAKTLNIVFKSHLKYFGSFGQRVDTLLPWQKDGY